jgi:LPXTG-motif cell wall-anchored protein
MTRLIAVFGLLLSLGVAPAAFAQQQPQITITMPPSGATVSGPDVTVAISVTGTTLVPAARATKLDDLHVHYMLDTDPAPYLSGTTPLPMGNPNIVHSGALSNVFMDVGPGAHRVAVVLGYSDHRVFQPPVAPTVNFTVAGQASVPTQLPRTGDAQSPAAFLLAAGLIGVALGLALRRMAGWGRANAP